MKFTLKNLGRLEEATIDLGQDLILLTGRNNTSKTYVAHAVYGFSQWCGMALAESILKRALPGGEDLHQRFEVDLVDLVAKNATASFADVGRRYQSQLADVFAADADFVSRVEVSVTMDDMHLEESLKAFRESAHHLPAPSGTTPFAARKEPGTGVVVFEQWALPVTETGRELREYQHLIMRLFLHVLVKNILSPHQPYVLTTERSAIQLFSRELSLKRSELVDDLLARSPSPGDQPLTSMLSRRARRYPLPIRDSLMTADDLATLAKTTSPYAHLAERLEREILEGTVRLGEGGEMRFHPEASASSLEMHLASSSVKSLSSLSFYLRHLAQKGDLLIIDEPELNLHPDNQRHVAKLLVRLAREGLKVMISTHSDYVIREINNAIMLSADTTGALREKYGYEERDTIRPERVGAYLFDATRARPIPVEPTGISVASIDEEINRLNQSSQDIYYTLFDQPKGA